MFAFKGAFTVLTTSQRLFAYATSGISVPRTVQSLSARNTFSSNQSNTLSLFRSFAAAKSSAKTASKSKAGSKKAPAKKVAAKPKKAAVKVVVNSKAAKDKIRKQAERKRANQDKAALQKERQAERVAKEKEKATQLKQKEKERSQHDKEKQKLVDEKEKKKLAIAKEKERKAALPRRPKSGYTLFVGTQLTSAKTAGKSVIEAMKAAAVKWGKMSDKEKSSFMAEANKDRARYTKEKAEVAKNAPPKRPNTAYISFVNDIRKGIMKEHPTYRVTEVAQEAGKRWKSLSEAEQEKYKKVAKKALDDFNKKYPKKE